MNDLAINSNQLALALQQVCDTTQWEYGEVWLSNSDHPTLQLTSVWCISDRLEQDRRYSWQQFRDCSEQFTLRHGEGLPGRVWVTQTSEWIADVSAELESYFLRNQIAKAFGVRAALGLPIHPKQLRAIAVFFKTEAGDRDEQVLKDTELILTQSLLGEM